MYSTSIIHNYAVQTYDELILKRLSLHDFRQNLHTASRISYHGTLTSSPPFLNLNATATGPHAVAPTAGPVTPASENPAQPATPSVTPSRTVVPAIPPAKYTASEPAVTETLAPTPAAAAAAQSHPSPPTAGAPTQTTASSPPDTVVPAAERLPEAQPAATPRRPGTGPSGASALSQQQSLCSGARS